MKGQLLFQRIEALPRPPWNSARHRFYIIVGWLPGCSDWLYSRKCSKTNHDLKSGRSDKTGPHPFRRYHKHLVAYNDSILETSVTTIAEVLVKKMCQLSGYCNTIEQFFFLCHNGIWCELPTDIFIGFIGVPSWFQIHESQKQLLPAKIQDPQEMYIHSIGSCTCHAGTSGGKS